MPWGFRGDAAAATWTFRGDAAAATWRRRAPRRRYTDEDDAAGLDPGTAVSAVGGSAGGVPISAIIGMVFGLLAACCLDRIYRRWSYLRFQAKQRRAVDQDAALFGDAGNMPRTDLNCLQQLQRSYWEVLQALCWSCGIVIVKPIDRVDYLRGRFEGKRVDAMFTKLKITDPAERLRWQDAWVAIDEDHSGMVDRKEFFDHFGFDSERDGPWADRIFAMFQSPAHNECAFLDFVETMVDVCCVDRAATERFSFRALSRFCDSNPEKFIRKRCLDVADLENFLLVRGYDRTPQEIADDPGRESERAATKKRAIKIANFIDSDCSGGVSFAEFLA